MEQPMMTRITAYEIAGNPDDIMATHAGPAKDGKYYGFITRGAHGRYRPLISTPAMFDTAEAADEGMRQLIIATTAWVENDFKDPQNAFVALLTGKEGPLVRQIVAATARD